MKVSVGNKCLGHAGSVIPEDQLHALFVTPAEDVDAHVALARGGGILDRVLEDVAELIFTSTPEEMIRHYNY